MWAELSRGNQVEYLGREGQEKVKGALTVLAAYCALREHPLQAGVDSPQQVNAVPLHLLSCFVERQKRLPTAVVNSVLGAQTLHWPRV